MGKEKQGMYGIVVMFFFLLAGIVGTVSAASVPDQLQLEVRLLEKINQLSLTNEQIGQILPILKQVDTTYDASCKEIDNLLAQEKELLLQRKTEEAEAIGTKIRVIREKVDLQVKQVLLDLEMIFTPEQKAMLKKIPGGQIVLSVTPKMPMGERRYAIITGKYDPPTQGNAKPEEKDKNYPDVKDKVQIETPVDGLKNVEQDPGLGRGRIVTQLEQAREWVKEHGRINGRMMKNRMMMREQRGMYFHAYFGQNELLKTLIQVLEELRAAGQ